MDPIAVLVKALEQTGRIVGGVRPDQLSAPTPCADWDVEDLLDHVISVVEMFDDAAQAKPFDASIFEREDVGADPGLAYQARAEVTEVAERQARIVPGDQVRSPVAFADPGSCPEHASAEDQLAAYLSRAV